MAKLAFHGILSHEKLDFLRVTCDHVCVAMMTFICHIERQATGM